MAVNPAASFNVTTMSVDPNDAPNKDEGCSTETIVKVCLTVAAVFAAIASLILLPMSAGFPLAVIFVVLAAVPWMVPCNCIYAPTTAAAPIAPNRVYIAGGRTPPLSGSLTGSTILVPTSIDGRARVGGRAAVTPVRQRRRQPAASTPLYAATQSGYGTDYSNSCGRSRPPVSGSGFSTSSALPSRARAPVGRSHSNPGDGRARPGTRYVPPAKSVVGAGDGRAHVGRHSGPPPTGRAQVGRKK